MIEVMLPKSDMSGDFLGVLVPHPSGVTYCNQVGGFTVARAKLEGIFLPLPIDLLENDHLFLAWAPLPIDTNGLVPLDKIDEAWTRMVADLVPELFRRPTPEEIESFSRQHPAAACVAEAWVPLTVREDLSPTSPGCWDLAGLLGPFRGQVVVLTYGNSD